MNASGGSLRNERVTAMQDTLNKTFADDPSYYFDVEVFNKPPLNCRIYDMTSATKRDGCMRIQTEIDRPVLVGDLVHWQTDWWLCTHQQNIHDMFWNGVIERCNQLLQWINKNGDVVERWSRAEDATKYTLGVTAQDQNMMLPDTRRSVLLPYDDETIAISDGKRFFIDKKVPEPKVFVVTNIDRVSKMFGDNGVIVLTCGETQTTVNDNKELMIADYYGKTPVYTLECLNAVSPFVVKLGDTYDLKFQATKDSEPVPSAEIKFTSSNPSVATIDQTATLHSVSIGTCKIMAALGDKQILLDLEVQEIAAPNTHFINLIDTDTDYQGEILLGDEKQLNVKMFNGSVDLDNFVWSCEMLNADAVAEIKEINNEAGNNYVIIRAFDNSKNVKKIFTVRVWNDELNVSAEMKVKVIGF